MFKQGDFKVTCPISGGVYLRSEMRMRWDGLLVHKSEWNPRHPQDTLNTRPEWQPRNLGMGEEEEASAGPTYNPSGL
jgi:hypothetical protein